MAAECTETSVANPNPNSSTQSWWQEIMHANSLCSWNTSNDTTNNNNNNGPLVMATSSNLAWQHSSNRSSESSGEDDVSISNQSIVTPESSGQLVDGACALPGEFISETSPTQNYLWSHLLLSGGSTREGVEYKSQAQQIGESMLNLSSSSSNTTTNFDIMSNCDDHYLKKMGSATMYEFIHGYGVHESQTTQPEMLDYLHQQPPIFSENPCGHIQDFSSICNNNSNNNGEHFDGYLSKPFLDMNDEYKPTLNPLQCLSSSPSGYDIAKKKCHTHLQTSLPRVSTCSTLARSNERDQGVLANVGKKKKKFEEDMEKMILKRPKDDNSSSKIQAPKVKLGDKITALQQLVSPFGKTDTASVLWEAIGHIRFLQEQIQLLTNAHAKSNARKDIPWGGLLVDGKKDVEDVDLRSRGLCLVPTSYTPQIFGESSASDCLIPPYRGCLYG